MKQFDVTQKTINGTKFFIRPFSGFKCAYLSGEVFSFLMPLLSSIMPAISGVAGSDNIMDADVSNIAPLISSGSAVSGAKLEKFLKMMLTDYGNISVEHEGETQTLTEDLVNEIFCAAFEDMIVLALEVLRINFPGILLKIKDLFGKLPEDFQEKMKELPNMVFSTRTNSQN